MEFESAAITDDMSPSSKYAELLARVANFLVATRNSLLSDNERRRIIGTDKWVLTVAHAVNLVLDNKDCSGFLKSCAYENSPYGQEVNTDDADSNKDQANEDS